MSDYPSSTTTLRPVRTVRFSLGMTLLGSVIGGILAGFLLDFALFAGRNFDELAPTVSIIEGAFFVWGASILVFLILGPVLGWGLGFVLRVTTNHNLHIMAFAVLGAMVGFGVGEYLGRLDGVSGLGTIAAPAVGIGAALGRWAISNHAKT
jgi:hypothetical protein